MEEPITSNNHKTPKFLPILGIVLTLIILVLTYYIYRSQQDKGYTPNPGSKKPADITIILTEDGYQPAEVTIKKGQTVKFTTSRNTQFWPASDLHPTHGIYPGFDPRQPVASNNSWSFTFDKAGQWKFHDHLSPNYRGIITTE